GPRWHSVDEVRDGAQERMVALRLPTRFAADLDAHPLHPALLDLATAEVRGSPGTTGDGDGGHQPHLPFLYRRVTVLAPLEAEVVSRIRPRATRPGQLVADVEVIGSGDRVLVAVEGFTMRRVDPAAFDGGADAPAGPREVVGIDPRAGTDVLMALLAARKIGR